MLLFVCRNFAANNLELEKMKISAFAFDKTGAVCVTIEGADCESYSTVRTEFAHLLTIRDVKRIAGELAIHYGYKSDEERIKLQSCIATAFAKQLLNI